MDTTAKMLDWIDSVKDRTKLSETQLMIVWDMKFVQGLSNKKIAKKIKRDRNTINLLFVTKEKVKEIKKKQADRQRIFLQKNPERRKRYKEYQKIYDEKRKLKNKNKNRYKKYDDKKAIKAIIKNEILKTPTKELKMSWDGIGKWSKEYDKCIECNTNIFQYRCRGLCKKCYSKLLYQNYDKEKLRQDQRKYRKKNKEKLAQRQKAKRSLEKKIFDQVKNGEIETTPKIENLLTNYEQLSS